MVFLANGSQPTAAARANGSHVATPAAILPQQLLRVQKRPLQGSGTVDGQGAGLTDEKASC